MAREPLDITIKVDADATQDAIKAARRDISKRTREGLVRAGERVALPDAKRFAPVQSGRLRNSLVVKSNTSGAWLTTSLRGKQGRYVRLLEFGGTARTPITPRRAKALVINGQPVAKVTSARRYKAQEFMSRSVANNRHRIADVVAEEVRRAFDGIGDD